jgi:PTS system ascorbate-specific IIA component
MGFRRDERPGPLDGSLSALLPVEAIRIGAAAEDWRTAVKVSGDALVASGATLDGYTDEMIATVEEFGPYIVIAPGIALAHSRPSATVRRAGLSVVTLARPVEFGHRDNDPVSLVVGLAAPDADSHLGALATLADFLSDEGRREDLLAATTAEAVRAMVVAFELQMANPG